MASHPDLSLTEIAINLSTELAQSLKREGPLRHGISHADVLRNYLDLLCLGKSDIKAVGTICEDEFFTAALSVDSVPSAETLRQRMDERTAVFLPLISEAMLHLRSMPRYCLSG